MEELPALKGDPFSLYLITFEVTLDIPVACS